MAKKVLVTATNYSTYCSAAKALLEENGVEVIENPYGRPMTRDELLTVVGDIDGVVVGVDTWNEEIFAHAPMLRAMARFGVGVDNIDLAAAKAHGIQVTNAKGMNSNPVAELTVGLILSTLRNVPAFNASIREGKWDRFMGRDLAGMTVGLLGFGDIAQRVAKKLSGFDVSICAYDLYPNLEKARELNVEMISMEETLHRADVVCMHLPSLPSTHHIMDAQTFGMMKDGSYFINTARGALVDETALAQALRSGKLTAAAIDVFDQEPVRRDNPLFALPNLFATPHTAAETYDTYHNVGLATARQLLDVFAGKKPNNLLN
ncbi:MAG: phosphoglycerate dehydrogenase [Clostridiales bacterium]|nr:phosphoglycerate dehydrogenase [Clostridiales bacterium]